MHGPSLLQASKPLPPLVEDGTDISPVGEEVTDPSEAAIIGELVPNDACEDVVFIMAVVKTIITTTQYKL